VAERRELGDVEAIAVPETDVRDRHDARLLVDERSVRGGREHLAVRLARTISAPRDCCAIHTCAIVGNSKSPSTTFRRSPSNDIAVAIVEMATDALGTIATSSASAPMAFAAATRRRSTCATHSSQGDPPVCHDSIYILSAPSTGIDSAPCEQLFT
jgi:hypothetical protein